ncbi:hypothetical protein [Kutzneria sp. 744]|uniref:hypothetical protein n=1 Tax=Kutzneria sp. (strain 744) TaxID=345341 RepID=UPI0006943045|nr:hypothetical protein [Kutzneria sp. 744]
MAGLPDLGLAAAVEGGVMTHRMALVPHTTEEAAGDVIAALLDGFDIVAVAADQVLTSGQRGHALARRLTARARNRATVLLSWGAWPCANLNLHSTAIQWAGRGAGRGYPHIQDLLVTVQGHGAAGRPASVHIRLRGAGAPMQVDAVVGVLMGEDNGVHDTVWPVREKTRQCGVTEVEHQSGSRPGPPQTRCMCAWLREGTALPSTVTCRVRTKPHFMPSGRPIDVTQ